MNIEKLFNYYYFKINPYGGYTTFLDCVLNSKAEKAYDFFEEEYKNFLTGDLFEDFTNLVEDININSLENEERILIRIPSGFSQKPVFYLIATTVIYPEIYSNRGEDVCIDIFKGNKKEAEVYFKDKWESCKFPESFEKFKPYSAFYGNVNFDVIPYDDKFKDLQGKVFKNFCLFYI